MKKFSFLLPVLMVMFLSCSDHASKVNNAQEVTISRKTETAAQMKTVANLSIGGMTCAAGCGGKIQQDLRALNGVNGTELDFQEGRTENVVRVEFDPAVTNEQEMIKCVAGIGDGQYQVKSIEIVDYKPQSSSGSSSSSVESGGFGRVFQVLNLLQSVARIVKG